MEWPINLESSVPMAAVLCNSTGRQVCLFFFWLCQCLNLFCRTKFATYYRKHISALSRSQWTRL
ncbi:unnamed protein product [Ixodes pacificus]